jgi:hypothetical protein
MCVLFPFCTVRLFFFGFLFSFFPAAVLCVVRRGEGEGLNNSLYSGFYFCPVIVTILRVFVKHIPSLACSITDETTHQDPISTYSYMEFCASQFYPLTSKTVCIAAIA